MKSNKHASLRRGLWCNLKASIHNFIYFIEKDILEPLIENENHKLRVAGFNTRLSHMDYDGGQMTNSMELKIIDGRVFENRFQIAIYKLTRFLMRLRESLDVSKDLYQGEQT